MTDLCPDCGRPKRRSRVYDGTSFCLAEAQPSLRGNCQVMTIAKLRTDLASALARAEAAEGKLAELVAFSRSRIEQCVDMDAQGIPAKRQVMSEDTPWVLVKTINGTGRWELPKKRKAKR